MTVFVIRDGALVAKGADRRAPPARSDFPAPMLSHMEPFESPVTGKEISSWRAREHDMAAVDAVDPRDLPAPTKGRKQQLKDAGNGRRPDADAAFKWCDPTPG